MKPHTESIFADCQLMLSSRPGELLTTIFALGSLLGPKHKTLTFLHFSFELANRRDELSNYTPFSCPLQNLCIGRRSVDI